MIAFYCSFPCQCSAWLLFFSSSVTKYVFLVYKRSYYTTYYTIAVFIAVSLVSVVPGCYFFPHLCHSFFYQQHPSACTLSPTLTQVRPCLSHRTLPPSLPPSIPAASLLPSLPLCKPWRSPFPVGPKGHSHSLFFRKQRTNLHNRTEKVHCGKTESLSFSSISPSVSLSLSLFLSRIW